LDGVIVSQHVIGRHGVGYEVVFIFFIVAPGDCFLLIFYFYFFFWFFLSLLMLRCFRRDIVVCALFF
jgi:hypothetical protein